MRMLICGLLVGLVGCSSEALKRTSYETLQNIEAERCGNDPGQQCAPRQSYDEYQRQRQQQ